MPSVLSTALSVWCLAQSGWIARTVCMPLYIPFIFPSKNISPYYPEAYLWSVAAPLRPEGLRHGATLHPAHAPSNSRVPVLHACTVGPSVAPCLVNALLSSFDANCWLPVTQILLRVCLGAPCSPVWLRFPAVLPAETSTHATNKIIVWPHILGRS